MAKKNVAHLAICMVNVCKYRQDACIWVSEVPKKIQSCSAVEQIWVVPSFETRRYIVVLLQKD